MEEKQRPFSLGNARRALVANANRIARVNVPQQPLVLGAVTAAQRAARAAVVAPPKKCELLFAQHARDRAVIARPDRRKARLRRGAGARRART